MALQKRQAKVMLHFVEDVCARIERTQHVASGYGLTELASRLQEAKDAALKALRLAEAVQPQGEK